MLDESKQRRARDFMSRTATSAVPLASWSSVADFDSMTPRATIHSDSLLDEYSLALSECQRSTGMP